MAFLVSRRLSVLLLCLLPVGCNWPLFGPADELVEIGFDSRLLMFQWLILALAGLHVLLHFFQGWDDYLKAPANFGRLRNLAEKAKNDSLKKAGQVKPAGPGNDSFLTTILPEQGNFLENQAARLSGRLWQMALGVLPANRQQQFVLLYVIKLAALLAIGYSIAGSGAYYLFDISLDFEGAGALWMFLFFILGLLGGTMTPFLFMLYYSYQNVQLLYYWLFPYCFAHSMVLILIRFGKQTDSRATYP